MDKKPMTPASPPAEPGDAPMDGPYVIVCRGHSGGRLVCEAFVRNGIAMGRLFPQTWDTRWFAPGGNRFMREIVLHAFDYPDLDRAGQAHYRGLLRGTVRDYLRTWIEDPQRPFGWKFGESVFAVPLILDTFPNAKVVHLVRDGRDVMLSRLDARFGERFAEPFNRVMVFGRPDADNYRGHPLTAATVERFREELEMLHWVTAVDYGLRGRPYAGRYLEVKYEDLCRSPLGEFDRLFRFLGQPMQPGLDRWLSETARTDRIGKWRALPPERLRTALEIGGPLLRRLGYLD